MIEYRQLDVNLVSTNRGDGFYIRLYEKDKNISSYYTVEFFHTVELSEIGDLYSSVFEVPIIYKDNDFVAISDNKKIMYNTTDEFCLLRKSKLDEYISIDRSYNMTILLDDTIIGKPKIQ